MIDFYGGAGAFASWPPRVRAYAVDTMPVNILDWAGAYGFPLAAAPLAAVANPCRLSTDGVSHSAAQRANALLAEGMRGTAVTIDGAAHFMITTHAGEDGGSYCPARAWRRTRGCGVIGPAGAGPRRLVSGDLLLRCRGRRRCRRQRSPL